MTIQSRRFTKRKGDKFESKAKKNKYLTKKKKDDKLTYES